MKKTTAELEQEIENIESRLSPERLFWDGERDRGEAMAEATGVNALLRWAFKPIQIFHRIGCKGFDA